MNRNIKYEEIKVRILTNLQNLKKQYVLERQLKKLQGICFRAVDML